MCFGALDLLPAMNAFSVIGNPQGSPPEKGLLARIRTASTALSRAERQVAEFLLQKPHDALDMSIRVLAQACNVSEPTVARFRNRWVLTAFARSKWRLPKAWQRVFRSCT